MTNQPVTSDMGPHRIVIIRHAEKPGALWGAGVDADGRVDDQSLAVRGWQRAGALARMFGAHEDERNGSLRPGAVFATGVGPGSRSKRSVQTAAPLVALLRERAPLNFVTTYLKDDGGPLMANVLVQTGVVLIAWEHKVLPSLVAHLPNAPVVPAIWPDDRFDLMWVLERSAHGWTFEQRPQLLLAGDSAQPII